MSDSIASQIALPLADARDGAPQMIALGDANRAAFDALTAPSGWPFGTAVLSGPPRSGKTLFARHFEREGHGTAIDDAHLWDETALFHRWNRAQANGERLLLVAGLQGETGWRIALPDLASRVGAALHLSIEAPDDALIGELILAHAAHRGLALGPDALTYLVPRIDRSFAGVERLVGAIDRLSLERKAAPTLGIWRAALDAVQGPEQARLL